jgi:hypothetical protein
MTVNAMSDGEKALLDCYRELERALRTHRGSLPPFAERNALKALACLWQIANDLDADPGQLYELGA